MTAPAVAPAVQDVVIPCDACHEPSPRRDLDVMIVDLRRINMPPGTYDSAMVYLHSKPSMCPQLSRRKVYNAIDAQLSRNASVAR